MIQMAERNRFGLNVTFRVMDAAAIRYPAATFDRLVGVQTMHHWRDTPAIVAELRRVIRPDGWGAFLDADPASEVPPDWIARQGPWPPDAWGKSR